MSSIIDLRKLSSEDLKVKLVEEMDSYQKLKMSHKVSAIEKPMDIRFKRRFIAKINTVLAEKSSK